MGVDGEEFGAGAERNLRFLKVLVPPVPPSHPPPLSSQGAWGES